MTKDITEYIKSIFTDQVIVNSISKNIFQATISEAEYCVDGDMMQINLITSGLYFDELHCIVNKLELSEVLIVPSISYNNLTSSNIIIEGFVSKNHPIVLELE